MEILVKLAWAVLALVHAAPAAVLFIPALTTRLYAIPAEGDAGVLLVHRGALFLAVLVAAVFAAFGPGARRLASLVVAISVVGYLAVYVRAGLPAGPLRQLAIVDTVALLPLTLVLIAAWWPRAA